MPGRHDIEVVQGDGWSLSLAWSIDVTGYVFDPVLAADPDGAPVPMAVTSPGPFSTVLSLSAEQTAALPAVAHRWRLRWTPPGGVPRTILRGAAMVVPDL